MKKTYKVLEREFPRFKAVHDTKLNTVKIRKLHFRYKRYQTVATLTFDEIYSFFKKEHQEFMNKWEEVNPIYTSDPLLDLTTSNRQVSAVVKRITGIEV